MNCYTKTVAQKTYKYVECKQVFLQKIQLFK